MIPVCILVPVLNRPRSVWPLVLSIEEAGGAPEVGISVLFLVSPDDTDERSEVDYARSGTGYVDSIDVEWQPGPGDYARKINLGAVVARDQLNARYLFLAADDLRFHPGWIKEALRVAEETGACVVGTNDLGNARVIAGHAATHSLVDVDYIECGTVDEPGKLLHEGYDHNFVDDELTATAKHRGVHAHADLAHVEHMHPNWGKGTDDRTYQKGMDRFQADHALFMQRSKLWS